MGLEAKMLTNASIYTQLFLKHYILPTVSTKAEVRFHVQDADWLPSRVKDRVHKLVSNIECTLNDLKGLLVMQYKNKITLNGELIVTSSTYRTQYKNLEDAVSKLENMLKEASEIPKGPSELTMSRVKQL